MTMSGMKRKPDLGGAMSMDDEYWDMVHNVPERDPSRPGALRQRAPGGGYISWPADSEPSIHFKKDGPMLVMRNGEARFLTWRERLQLWLGRTSADDLEYRHNPYLRQVR